MQHGSLVNAVSNNAAKTPEVGMGATYLGWSDRYPGTIIEVLSPTRIRVQRDNAKRIDSNGMSESQTYEFTADPNGQISTLTLRKNGRWVPVGADMKTGPSWVIGYRSRYYDYSF